MKKRRNKLIIAIGSFFVAVVAITAAIVTVLAAKTSTVSTNGITISYRPVKIVGDFYVDSGSFDVSAETCEFSGEHLVEESFTGSETNQEVESSPINLNFEFNKKIILRFSFLNAELEDSTVDSPLYSAYSVYLSSNSSFTTLENMTKTMYISDSSSFDSTATEISIEDLTAGFQVGCTKTSSSYEMENVSVGRYVYIVVNIVNFDSDALLSAHIEWSSTARSKGVRKETTPSSSSDLLTLTIGETSKVATFTEDLTDLVDGDFSYENNTQTYVDGFFEMEIDGTEDFIVIDEYDNVYLQTTIVVNSQIASTFTLYEEDEETILTKTGNYYNIMVHDGEYAMFFLKFTYNSTEYTYALGISNGGVDTEFSFAYVVVKDSETSSSSNIIQKSLTYSDDIANYEDDEDIVYTVGADYITATISVEGISSGDVFVSCFEDSTLNSSCTKPIFYSIFSSYANYQNLSSLNLDGTQYATLTVTNSTLSFFTVLNYIGAGETEPRAVVYNVVFNFTSATKIAEITFDDEKDLIIYDRTSDYTRGDSTYPYSFALNSDVTYFDYRSGSNSKVEALVDYYYVGSSLPDTVTLSMKDENNSDIQIYSDYAMQNAITLSSGSYTMTVQGSGNSGYIEYYFSYTDSNSVTTIYYVYVQVKLSYRITLTYDLNDGFVITGSMDTEDHMRLVYANTDSFSLRVYYDEDEIDFLGWYDADTDELLSTNAIYTGSSAHKNIEAKFQEKTS